MLLQIKEKITGWIAYAIVGLITIPFALWGINFYFQSDNDPVMFSVGDFSVKLREFNQEILMIKQDFQRRTSREISNVYAQQRVINEILRSQIVSEQTKQYDYYVPDRDLGKHIAQQELFQIDGRFNRKEYLQQLKQLGYSQNNFEEKIRHDLINKQFSANVNSSEFVLEHEKKLFEHLMYQEREIKYVEIPYETFIGLVSVEEEEAEEYYQDNLDDFYNELRARYEYVEFQKKDFFDEIEEVTEDELRIYFEENSSFYSADDEREYAHILINPNKEGREQETQEFVDLIYNKLITGEDFTELAKTYSDDSLTAKDGGYLGILTYEDIEDTDIADAIFVLQQGEFTQPLETEYGIQIFQLVESVDIDALFERNRADIEYILKLEKAKPYFQDYYDDISTLSYENFDSLDPVAEALELEIHETDWITISDTSGIFQYPKVQKAAFSKEVLEEGNNSEVLVVGERDHVIVIRVSENELAVQMTYEESKNKIMEKLQLEKAIQKGNEEAAKMFQKVQNGKQLDKVIKDYNLEIISPGFVNRFDIEEVDSAIINTAYKIKEVSANQKQPNYKLHKLGANKGLIMVALLSIKEGQIEEDEKKHSLSFFIPEMNMVLQTLVDKFEIFVNQEELDKLNKEL